MAAADAQEFFMGLSSFGKYRAASPAPVKATPSGRPPAGLDWRGRRVSAAVCRLGIGNPLVSLRE
jgi:hypothetical protein